MGWVWKGFLDSAADPTQSLFSFQVQSLICRLGTDGKEATRLSDTRSVKTSFSSTLLKTCDVISK